jgi:A/G-specific adenine glycosylase
MRRDLPWRRTSDPYRIWISEVMLQQTRVAAVLGYYERFLARFPDVCTLAAADESDLLAAWAGLGYYSRARNLQKAAKAIVENGRFPSDAERILALPGIGAYTAAAVGSIAFSLPLAVVDGNVMRVLARLSNDPGDIGSGVTRARMTALAGTLLDSWNPGDYNQAVMELGATVCLPRNPQCLLCPVAEFCEGRKQGTASQLPVKLRRIKPVYLEKSLLRVEKSGAVLMWKPGTDSSRMRGFWELPERDHLPAAKIVREIGEFSHSITYHRYRFKVLRARIGRTPQAFSWISLPEMTRVPLSTIARKALAL